jgi:ABC-2 type transport system permease protein
VIDKISSSGGGFPVKRNVFSQLASVWTFGIREFRMWRSYRMNQIMWINDILISSFLFFLIGKMVGGRSAELLGVYGSNYITFILIGMGVNYLIATNLHDPFARISRVYWDGTMDLYLLSPMSIYTPLIGLMARSVIDDYPRVFFIVLFGTTLFGARFSLNHIPASLLFSVLILVSSFGIGMMSASTFYLFDFKRTNEPVRFFIQEVLAALVAGTYYPVTVLPYSLQIVAAFLPHTYAYDALRRLLCPDTDLGAPNLVLHRMLPSMTPLQVDGLALAVSIILFIPLGLWLYRAGIEKARRNGTLTRWQ